MINNLVYHKDDINIIVGIVMDVDSEISNKVYVLWGVSDAQDALDFDSALWETESQDELILLTNKEVEQL